MKRTFLAGLIGFFLLAPSSADAQGCAPVPNAAEDQAALNWFWNVAIPLCRIPTGSANAYANRLARVVFADQDWLDQIANHHGSWAATGILAHEWGHIVQGPVSGTAAELQADCLAGVFMRGAGLTQENVRQFAQANFFAGDAEWSFGGHGTSAQRVTAAIRGYTYYTGNRHPAVLLAICPLSAF